MCARLIELDEAREIVLREARPLGEETLELSAALTRALAHDVTATHPVPPFDCSAMDGFAVRAGDLDCAGAGSPVRLEVIGESRAGHPAAQALTVGQAIAISTGAVLPEGADAVVRLEDAHSYNGHVEVLTPIGRGTAIRRAGDDVTAGATVLRGGTRLGPAELGVLASIGVQAPLCFRRPRVAILTTGDELAAPDELLEPGMVHDSNSYSVPALARGAGADVVSVDRATDDPRATSDAIASLLDADVAVVCGGVSVGAHDHVQTSLAQLGVDEHFYGIALKPGKPTWFGSSGRTLVFALPGNPVSAMVTFILLVRPALWARAGIWPQQRRSSAILARDYAKQPGRAHAVRCTLELHEDGWRAEPTGPQDSHILTSMLGAEALAIIPTDSGSVRAGERVEIELLSASPSGRPRSADRTPAGDA